MPSAPLRAAVGALVLFALSAAPSAQVVDPQTGEPVPLGITPPPEAPLLAVGGGEPLEPFAHLPAGSTRTVRALGDTGFFVHSDGAELLLGEYAILTINDGEFVYENLARVTLPGLPTDAVVDGDRLYVTLSKAPGLIVFDVTGLDSGDPAFEEVARADVGSAFAVAVDAERVYVGRGTAGVSVLDRETLGVLGSFDTPGSANGLATTFFDFGAPGLVVADGNVDGEDIGIYDMTDPAAAFQLNSVEAGGFATYVAIEGDVAFVTGAAGLLAVSLLDGSVLDTLPAGGTTFEVALDGAGRAVVNGLGGVQVVDISDPTDLTEIASDDFGGQGLTVAVRPGFDVLAGDRFGGLRVYATFPDSIDEIGRVPNGGFSHKPVFDAPTERLFATDLAGRLRTFSVPPDGAAAEIAEIVDARTDVPSNTQEVLVSGGVAYVTHAAGLTVLDVSGAGPYPQLTDVPLGQSYGMALQDDVLYVAAGFTGLVALDVSDPAAPGTLSATPIGANVVDVDVTAFPFVAYIVSFGGGMLSYDISDPAAPTQLDAEPDYGFLNALDVDREAFVGKLAYVADGQQGLRVVDIGTPGELDTIDTHPVTSQARDAAVGFEFFSDVFASIVYVADDFFGLQAFPEFEQPRSFASADRGIGVATRNDQNLSPDLAALAAGEAGIYLFEGTVEVASEPSADGAALGLVASPNPVRAAAALSLTLAEAANVEVTVYDALGRRVAMWSQPMAAGAQRIALDTRGWAPGVYVARVTAGEAVATARLTVVR